MCALQVVFFPQSLVSLLSHFSLEYCGVCFPGTLVQPLSLFLEKVAIKVVNFCGSCHGDLLPVELTSMGLKQNRRV